MNLDSKIPEGPLEQKWDSFKSNMKLINPSNKRKYKILVVGTGLAGASAAASLAELGYQVETFCFQDSPRRAHSIAAQGGINAAKNYQNDGDSIWRLWPPLELGFTATLGVSPLAVSLKLCASHKVVGWFVVSFGFNSFRFVVHFPVRLLFMLI